MKRMHIHVSVEEIEKSVGFYAKLFGAEPTVQKADYAKWMLDDPLVNFAISSHEGAARGIEHIGIQTENAGELAEVYGRIREAGGAIIDEGSTTCCYAQSEKNWTVDPDGVAWEAFLTNGEVTEYGQPVNLEQLASAKTGEDSCCTPQTAQGICCPPKPDKAAGDSCCG